MAVIPKKQSSEKQEVRFRVDKSLLDEISKYCKWADLEDDCGHFFVEAANFVFAKDTGWKKAKKQQAKAAVANAE